MTNELEAINESLFESIKHINEYGQEYWEARELQPVLEYKQWRQFADVRKTSPMPNGGFKQICLSPESMYKIEKKLHQLFFAGNS